MVGNIVHWLFTGYIINFWNETNSFHDYSRLAAETVVAILSNDTSDDTGNQRPLGYVSALTYPSGPFVPPISQCTILTLL